ncbi:hypothetical protein [Pseudobacter ginsenosidimutans]|jgi:hypothetical protein|uniref:Uncharacterized protein n=1 Tax=Pseudobacter ginsenosidimutans TaxID=661488 RepID=A0A4Q7N4Q8_9BACT|nr:hypothetical protein [Pseudobacter ginsenosidimutans]QEC44536.1 hypothetical protein FSB84_23720 [Pseudobacter ginsenosidimutans]RZS76013.1 hypothetical protein EV199_1889 [Pseudobacter ginsenosidimutans]
MRSVLLTALFCLSACLFFQCSKENKGNVSAAPLTARPQHNTSNYGLYKGVFTGSTGIIVISLRNENDNVFATARIDGALYHFTAVGILELNKPTSLLFRNSNSSFNFMVYGDGSTPTISGLTIEAHPGASIILFKERSDALVRCYEGTFTGSQQGTWNLIVRKHELTGLVKTAGTTTIANGIVKADQTITGGLNNGATFEGKFVKNDVAGTWQNSTGDLTESGVWTGIRTY